MAIKVNPHTDTQYDHIQCEVEYVVDQDHPSPALMADYERDGERGISDAEFHRLHKVRSPSSTGPCSNGSRVRKYIERRDEIIWTCELGDAFGKERATPVKDLLDSVDGSFDIFL